MNYARTRFGIASATGLWLCSLLLSMPASPAPMLDSLPTIDVLRNRLELTPQQEAQLAPLFDQRVSELRETRQLLEQASTRQQKRDVLREAKKAGDAFNAQVESVLSPSQQHEWREFVSELKDKARERAEQKREAG